MSVADDFCQQRVLSHEEDSALLKAYIAEWSKFFTQCDYLPKPFNQLEVTLQGKAHSTLQKKNQGEESIVRKVTSSTSCVFFLLFLKFCAV
jgi:cullin-5